MYFGLVHYPQVDLKLVDQIRRKYDPTVDLVQPHITVMFLVPESAGEGKLAGHLKHVLSTCKPIPIRMRGLCKTPDHWLLLTLEDGNPEVARLLDDGCIVRFHHESPYGLMVVPNYPEGRVRFQPWSSKIGGR